MRIFYDEIDILLIELVHITKGVALCDIFFKSHLEAVIGEGLYKIVHDAEMQRLLKRFPVVGCRYHNHLNRYFVFSDLTQCFKPVHLRHIHIKNDKIDRLMIQKFKCAFAVITDSYDLKFFISSYILLVDHGNHRIIFNNQYPIHLFSPIVSPFL